MRILEALFWWTTFGLGAWVIGFPTYKKFINKSVLDNVDTYIYGMLVFSIILTIVAISLVVCSIID